MSLYSPSWLCHRYNKLVGMVKSLMTKLRDLSPKDAFRVQSTNHLLEKLYVNLQICVAVLVL